MAAGAGPDDRSPAGSGGYELVVAGRAWRDGKLRPIEVGIDEDGWIRRVARSLREAGHRIDYGESVLLPAGTDVVPFHAHITDPDALATLRHTDEHLAALNTHLKPRGSKKTS